MVEKKEAQPIFSFNELRSVWISDETLFRMFDMASQSIDNSKKKFTEFYDNKDHISKPPSRNDFLCFLFMNY